MRIRRQKRREGPGNTPDRADEEAPKSSNSTQAPAPPARDEVDEWGEESFPASDPPQF